MTLLLPLVVLHALQQAAPAGARVEVLAWRPQGACEPDSAEVRGPLHGSGSVALRIAGRGCSGWAFADARVTAQVLVATEAAREGQPVHAALEWREVRAGHEALAEIPASAVAARDVARGSVIEASMVREPGPKAGAPVRVVLRDSAITLELVATAVPCARGLACALLPSGKRVEGHFEGDAILVEMLP
ncbi:MAG TPA: hypothetical protein VLW85_09595 [Myxococcales bacterium]|nr:hypothetical protein [Myxococcales bacterium]